jgi:hypothetical protein
VEVAEQPQAQAPPFAHPHLDSSAGLQAEILIARFGRRHFLRKGNNSALGLKVGLDGLLAPPLPAESDWRKPYTRHVLPDVLGTTWIWSTEDRRRERLVQQDEGQKLRHIIHLCTKKMTKRMAVVFNSSREELHIVAGSKYLIVAVGSQTLEEDFTLNGLLGRLYGFTGTHRFQRRRRYCLRRNRTHRRARKINCNLLLWLRICRRRGIRCGQRLRLLRVGVLRCNQAEPGQYGETYRSNLADEESVGPLCREMGMIDPAKMQWASGTGQTQGSK